MLESKGVKSQLKRDYTDFKFLIENLSSFYEEIHQNMNSILETKDFNYTSYVYFM